VVTQVTIKEVVLFGDPRLRTKTRAVDLQASDWQTDASDLAETLGDLQIRLGFGRALAAPQIGSIHRLIAFKCSLGNFVAVNPRIVWESESIIPVWDDCFSLPGVCMAVIRKASISFECHDQDGNLLTFERLGPSASELVQHEIDHLDGMLMLDRLVEPDAIIAAQMASKTVHPAAARR
jgi:peptide deformylase